MMVQPEVVTPLLYISDCESYGHRMTLSVFQKTCKGTQTKLSAGVAEVIRKEQERPGPAPMCPQFLRDTSFPLFPENCTKPIKEDTVAFHAA